jgi:hypothetical protein
MSQYSLRRRQARDDFEPKTKGGENMKYRNFTPHEITIAGFMPLPSEGVARISETVEVSDIDGGLDSEATVGELEECPPVVLVTASRGPIFGLPEPEPGTMYIVSGMLLDAAKAAGRSDCCAPFTGVHEKYGPVRESGRIIAVRALLV